MVYWLVIVQDNIYIYMLQSHEWTRPRRISTGMTLPLTEFERRMLQHVV